MVAPVIVAAGVVAGAQVLSSIAQYYQSEKARKASAEKLKEIEDLFNAIKPPEYDVSPLDPPEYITTAIPEPAFDLSDIKPSQYAVASKYMPEVANYIGEMVPAVVIQTAEGAAGRRAQIEALNQLRMRTGELADAEAETASQRALREAQIASQSRSQSILQDFDRRGQLGSGAMLAAQLQGSSDAMERAANVSGSAYLDALRNKLGALRESGDMGRQVAQDELSQQRVNADIINSYNQRAAANLNNYLQNAADTRNRGQLYNVQQAQDVANRNVDTSNEFSKMNRQRQDAMLEYLDKRRLGERDFQNQMAQQQYNARAAEKQRQANLKTQIFDNEMQRARGMAGIGGDIVRNNYQSAADRNQAYQGFSDTIGSGARAWGNYAYQSERDKKEDERYDRMMKAKYGDSYGG